MKVSAALAGKAVLMPMISVRSLRAAPPTSPAGALAPVVAAQALSWAGDLALEGRSRGWFLAGLGSFLGAHLAYIRAYRARASAPVLGTPAGRGVVAAGTAL